MLSRTYKSESECLRRSAHSTPAESPAKPDAEPEYQSHGTAAPNSDRSPRAAPGSQPAQGRHSDPHQNPSHNKGPSPAYLPPLASLDEAGTRADSLQRRSRQSEKHRDVGHATQLFQTESGCYYLFPLSKKCVTRVTLLQASKFIHSADSVCQFETDLFQKVGTTSPPPKQTNPSEFPNSSNLRVSQLLSGT